MKSISLSIIILTTTYLIAASQVSQKIDSLYKNDTVFYPDNPDPDAFVQSETMPEFPGGLDSLVAFVKRHLYYPQSLIKDSIEGRIYIRFSIDDKGLVGDIAFLRSLHPELEQQCIEMLKKMPRFKPGTMLTKSEKGWYWRLAKTWFMLPIYFTPKNEIPKYFKIVITPKFK